MTDPITMTPSEVSDYIAGAGRDAWLVPDVPDRIRRAGRLLRGLA